MRTDYNSVLGIKYFKAGNNVEAFQCLNQALNIDNDNVEGLVARGALYANNGGLDKAVEDFDKALTINRNHKNARKYLCETLIAVARNHEDENKVDCAIATYQRILTIVPDHKEALDSVYFLQGKPKDAPLRDDPMKQDRNKPKLLLDEYKKSDKPEKTEKKKKKKRRKDHSSGSSSDSSFGSEESRRHKKKKKKESKSKSPSPFSRCDTRPISPFSVRMASGAGGVPAGGDMNMPEGFKPQTDQNPNMNLPLPDLRQDIERIKSQKSVEGEARIPPGFPLIDLTKPPPGYNPYYQGQYSHNSEKEYDEKVRRFLQETTSDKKRTDKGRARSRHRSERKPRKMSRSRSRSREKRRKSRERSRGRSRDRVSRRSRSEKSKDRIESKDKKSRRSRTKSIGTEAILIEDDDFTKKLNDHLTGSEKERSLSRGRTSKRSNSKERKSDILKDKKEKRKSSTNIFGSDDDLNSSREEVGKSRRPSGGGMWIPTGQDSIVVGVKEAINKLGGQDSKDKHKKNVDEKKTSRIEMKTEDRNFEIKFDKRTGMYIRMAKDEEIVNCQIEVPKADSPAKIPSKKRSRSHSKDRQSRRSSRSRSKTRRSRRSRSRLRRSRSRSRRQRSRHRSSTRRSKHRKSRSRNRNKTRRGSGDSKRSQSRSVSNDRSWKDRGSWKEAQSSLQQEITGIGCQLFSWLNKLFYLFSLLL